MKRGFLFFCFCVLALFYGWDHLITRDGLGLYIEKHPETWAGDTILYGLGSFHEVINQDRKALRMYERVVQLYPDSPRGDVAQFGVASSCERLKDRRRSLVEYELYKEKYPKGRYITSVARNIEVLKGF